MADRNVKLKGDASSLVKALTSGGKAMDSFKSKAKSAANRLRELNKIKITGKSIKNLSDAFKSLARSTVALSKVNAKGISDSVRALSKIDISANTIKRIATISKEIRSLNSSLNSTSKASGKFRSGIRTVSSTGVSKNSPNFATAAPGVEKLRTNVSSLNKALLLTVRYTNQVVSNVQRLGVNRVKQFTQATAKANVQANSMNVTWQSIARYWVTGAVIGQVRNFTLQIQESVSAAAELSVKLAEIQTIAGEGISDAVIANQVRELSDTFTGDIKDQAEAFYQALSNGVVEAANAQSFLIDANKLALASVSSVTDATNLLSSVINSYGLETTEATRISDVFFKAVEVGRFRIGEIANTIGRTTVVASQLGVSYQEVATGLAFITKQGTTAANAQTLLRNILLKLIKPTEETANILRELGFESGQQLIAVEGLGGALQTLFKATSGGASDIAKLFNSIRALQGALAFQGGQGNFDELASEIENSAGAAERAAAKIQNSLGKQFQLALEQTTNVLTQDFGEAILKTLADADGSFTSFIDTVKDLISIVTPFVKTVVLLIKAIRPLVPVLLAATAALVSFKIATAAASLAANSFNISSLISGFTRATSVIGLMNAKTVTATVAYHKLATAQFAAANSAGGLFKLIGLAPGPLGLLVAGVAALTVGFVLLTNSTSEADEALADFAGRQRTLTDSIKKTSQSLADAATSTDRLLGRLERLRARSANEALKKLRTNLKGVEDSLIGVRDKQGTFEEVFGSSLDKATSDAKSNLTEIQASIDKVNELLGRGAGDNTLITGLNKELKLLELQAGTAFDPFSKLDLIGAQFKLVEDALKSATDVSTVEKLSTQLKSLADEQAGISKDISGPFASQDDRIAQEIAINKLTEERLGILGRVAARDLEREKSSSIVLNQLDKFLKTQEESISKVTGSTDELNRALVSVNKEGVGGDSLEGARKAFDVIRERLLDIKTNNSSLTPIIDKQLEKYKEQEDALERQIQAVKEGNNALIIEIQQLERIKKLRQDAAKAAKDEKDATGKLSTTLQGLQTLTVGDGNAARAGNRLAGIGVTGTSLDSAIDTSAFSENVFLGFSNAVKNLFPNIGTTRVVGGDTGLVSGDALSEQLELAQAAIATTVERIELSLRKGNFEEATKLAEDPAFANSLRLFKIINDNLNKELDDIIQNGGPGSGERRQAILEVQEQLGLKGLSGILSQLTKDGGQGIGQFIQSLTKQVTTQQSATTVMDAFRVKLDANREAIEASLTTAERFARDLNDAGGEASDLAEALSSVTREVLNLVPGNPTKKFGGGRIFGAAGVDRVPAMLTAGEFVMTKAATQQFLPQLHQMNRGVPPQHFAKGGLVGSLASPSSVDSSTSVGDINVSVTTTGDVNPRALATEINRQIRVGNIRFRD